ncbi:hypothetical protein LTR95_016673 [Oleoguttula sp. CCFEE 5521]
MAVSAVAAGLAGLTATAAYLDAKYHIRHDLRAGSLEAAAIDGMQFVTERQIANRLLLYHVLEDHANGKSASNLFLEYEGRTWTYKAFYDDVQRVGNWLLNDLDIQKGEMVALNGPNSAEYLILWFALDGIGARQALINCNLTGEALQHCVKICSARYMLTERSLEPLVESSIAALDESKVQIVYFDESSISSLPSGPPLPEDRRTGIQVSDTKGLIYTSGTTGLPKGTILRTGRWLLTARSMATYLELKPSDKFYTCLPLYHGAAQGLCTTPVLWAGASMTLGRKFSHKTFWPEVSASRANRLQYVGELCRYLVNAPLHPLERQHRVNEAWGNGMRPDVWERFRSRFNIPVIHELYAATDGMGSTFNANRGDFSRSAIGVRGALWDYRNSANQVRLRIDPDTEDLIRDSAGRVVKSAIDEPGEVVHKIDPLMKESAFAGYYQNASSTEKRWMTNVFEKGDLWFRSGDVMRQDHDGRVYFVDRLGDTFRWKSENVSTNEVADVVGAFHQIDEANVYGVAVPNADGRCGCAAVVLKAGTSADALDLAGLARHVVERLPRYAVPIFLRVTAALSYTGTFKVQKGQAKREGIDLDLIGKSGGGNRMFWLRPGGSAYEPFTRDCSLELQDGKVRL